MTLDKRRNKNRCVNEQQENHELGGDHYFAIANKFC